VTSSMYDAIARNGYSMKGSDCRADGTDDAREHPRRKWWETMLRDPQWWVPLIVLVGGLLVLRWVQ
jgi:hypothetical protein